MQSKKNKRKLRKGFVIFLIVLIIFAILSIYYYAFPQNIRNISISGNNYLSDLEIMELAEIDEYPNFITTRISKIRKKLINSPYILNVEVKKKFFYKIDIIIEENKLLFVRLDTNKIVFGDSTEIDYDKEILDIPYLINYVPNTKYDSLIKKLNKIDNNVISKISEIKYDPNDYDEDRFLLYMNDGNKVYVTLTKLNLLNKYNETVTKLEGKTGILYLDSGNYFEILK